MNSNKNKEGTVLFLAIAIILALSAISLTTYTVMLSEISMNKNQVNTTRALYDADSGIKFVKRIVENELESGSTVAAALSGRSITAPSGFNFDTINDFEIIVPERIFRFSATGRSGKAKTTIEASLRRDSVIEVGIFGEDQVYMFPGSHAHAYDSSVDKNVNASRVHGGSSIGSNGYVDFKSGSHLDGTVVLGQTSVGSAASCSGCQNYPITNTSYIDPDPLGIVGGQLADEMADLAVSNDNSTSPLITGRNLFLAPNQTGTLTAGSYYLSKLELKSGSILTVDSSAGPVKLYVTGDVRIWPGSDINNNGKPGDLQIYSTTTHPIKILPNTAFTGMVYAPSADILAMPNGNYNGLVWGKNAYVKPGGAFNVDVALLDQFLFNKLEIDHWKEVRTE